MVGVDAFQQAMSCGTTDSRNVYSDWGNNLGPLLKTPTYQNL